MKESKINRSSLVQVRLTPSELKILNSRASSSTSRKRSDYLRRIILGRPVTITHRNQSLDDFITEMITLRHELNAIAVNYNQLVKRLHSLQHLPELKSWLILNESTKKILMKKIEEIKIKINQINDQWLQ